MMEKSIPQKANAGATSQAIHAKEIEEDLHLLTIWLNI